MKTSSRMLIAIVFAALLTCIVSPCDAATKSIDKRTYSDRTGNRYFVVFVARGGTPTGHAYVAWGTQTATSCSQVGYGFYPVSTVKAIAFQNVPGTLVNEAFNTNSTLITDRLIVEVNKEAFFDSQKACVTWATTDYNKFSSNCINFAMDCAKRTGLRVPSKDSIQTPSSYMQRLINSN